MAATTQPALHTQHKIYQQFIDGEWVDASTGETFDRVGPYDGMIVGTYANGGVEDAQRALEAARKAFDTGGWSTSGRERARVLRRVAQLMLDNAEELITTSCLEEGIPRTVAAGTLGNASAQVEVLAAKALLLKGEAVSQEISDGIGLVLREAMGVVATIIPFNVTIALAFKRVATALAAGCTVVLKPSHLASGTSLIVARLFAEAGLPPGVLNVVTSETDNGALVGRHLVGSPLTDKVSFTGSTASGRDVMRTAAANITNVSLELGGKAPQIILPDAPIDAAVEAAALGAFMNSGQVCACGSRLLVSNKVREAFLEGLTAKARALTLGDPLDESTSLGPVISTGQLGKIEGYLERGRAEGSVVLGGRRATRADLARGLFVEPTIFDEVSADATIAREEIFGPVLTVIPFDDPTDVIDIANNTDYGLTASVWTRDINAALTIARSVRAGTVFVNAYYAVGAPNLAAMHGGTLVGLTDMPEGGFKQSGLGRDTIEEYLETKSIHINLDPALS